MPTTNNGIYYPDLSTGVDTLQGVLATMASSVENAVFTDKVQIHKVDTIVQRDALVAGFSPSMYNPLVVWRTEAPQGWNLEATTDGTNWYTYGQAGRGGTPYRIQSGVVTVTVSGSAAGTAPITFTANRFTAPPVVQLTKQSAGIAKFNPYIAAAVTVSGTTIGVYSGDGSTGSGSVSVAWTAIQMTPGSATG